MKENELKELVRRELDAEAAALEQKIEANEELASLEMREGSFDDLMARIAASRKENAAGSDAVSAADENTRDTGSAGNTAGSNVRPFHIRKRTLLAVALVAILIAAMGLGTTGAKLFTPKVENQGENGELSLAIDSDDVLYLRDVTEDEAYAEIEEKLGILALRLMEKPNGLQMKTVCIDEALREAIMEFECEGHILTIYENKQHDSASTGTEPDGIEIDTIETFFLEKTLVISEIDKGNGEVFYRTEFEHGDAYYCLSFDAELELFKTILNGIIFDAM